MGVTIDIHRARIGEFNGKVGGMPSLTANITTMLHMCLSLGLVTWLVFLLILSGIHPNPGPNFIGGFLLNTRNLKSINKNRNKLLDFQTIVGLKSPKIISVTESWLNKSISNGEILNTDLYNIYIGKIGHGVQMLEVE